MKAINILLPFYDCVWCGAKNRYVEEAQKYYYEIFTDPAQKILEHTQKEEIQRNINSHIERNNQFLNLLSSTSSNADNLAPNYRKD